MTTSIPLLTRGRFSLPPPSGSAFAFRSASAASAAFLSSLLLLFVLSGAGGTRVVLCRGAFVVTERSWPSGGGPRRRGAIISASAAAANKLTAATTIKTTTTTTSRPQSRRRGRHQHGEGVDEKEEEEDYDPPVTAGATTAFDDAVRCVSRRRRSLLSGAASTAFGGVAAVVAGVVVGPASAADGQGTAAPMGTAQQQPQQPVPRNKRLVGLASKIRKVGNILDELQRDLMQERWDLVENYPAQLRSYVPVFTTYTDSAFATDAPTDRGLRVALRYEVGRFFACVERFKQASSREALDEAYVAYSDMSLHFDRYLRVGGLYTYYDDLVSTEPYFVGIGDDALVYSDPARDPPLVRDLVVLVRGPEKGKTGIVIGKYSDGTEKIAIKLDRYKGIREIRVVQRDWVAKRLGEQAPDDVFLIPRKG